MIEGWQKYWNQNVGAFLDSTKIYDATVEYIPIRFLHLYDPTPVRTDLLCNILPNTPRSCQASIEEDKKGVSELAHMNQGKADRIWFDQLAVEAVEQQLVHPKVARRGSLTIACMRHHETVLNRTMLDFPHRCPHRDAILAMWDISWEKEKELLGESANRTRHLEILRQNLKSGKHCNIDAKQTVLQEEWKAFFAEFQANKTA